METHRVQLRPTIEGRPAAVLYCRDARRFGRTECGIEVIMHDGWKMTQRATQLPSDDIDGILFEFTRMLDYAQANGYMLDIGADG